MCSILGGNSSAYIFCVYPKMMEVFVVKSALYQVCVGYTHTRRLYILVFLFSYIVYVVCSQITCLYCRKGSRILNVGYI